MSYISETPINMVKIDEQIWLLYHIAIEEPKSIYVRYTLWLVQKKLGKLIPF